MCIVQQAITPISIKFRTRHEPLAIYLRKSLLKANRKLEFKNTAAT